MSRVADPDVSTIEKKIDRSVTLVLAIGLL